MEIRTIRKGSKHNNNYVSIPKESKLKVGDLVVIKKAKIEVKEEWE